VLLYCTGSGAVLLDEAGHKGALLLSLRGAAPLCSRAAARASRQRKLSESARMHCTQAAGCYTHPPARQAGWPAGPPRRRLTILACVECALHPSERLLSRHPVQLRQQAGAHGAGTPAPAPAAGRQARGSQAGRREGRAAAMSQGGIQGGGVVLAEPSSCVGMHHVHSSSWRVSSPICPTAPYVRSFFLLAGRQAGRRCATHQWM
jgi:hypothetical protein